MSSCWIDGDLRDGLDDVEQARLALATLPCPTAFVAPGRSSGPPLSLASTIAAEELAQAADRLGHGAPTVAALTADIELLGKRHGVPVAPGQGSDAVAGRTGAASAPVRSAQVIQLALVPDGPLPASAAVRWAASRLVAWWVSTPDGRLRVVEAPWPVNESSPATAVRFAVDGDIARGRHHATASGGDVALWHNLADEVARVDAWTVVVAADGTLVAPRSDAGGPFDRWLDRLVDAGVVRRAPVTRQTWTTAGAGAALTPWGDAVALEAAGFDADRSHELAARLQRGLRKLRA